MTRPKSTTAKRRTRSSGATIANSTSDWLRCDRYPVATVATLEASNDHVGVNRHVHRVAQYAGHEPGCKSVRHHHDYVYIGTFVAVVRGGGREVQARRVRIADVEQRLIRGARGVGVICVRRVELAVAIARGGGTGPPVLWRWRQATPHPPGARGRRLARTVRQ